jgi:hypothetical protein
MRSMNERLKNSELDIIEKNKKIAELEFLISEYKTKASSYVETSKIQVKKKKK